MDVQWGLGARISAPPILKDRTSRYSLYQRVRIKCMRIVVLMKCIKLVELLLVFCWYADHIQEEGRGTVVSHGKEKETAYVVAVGLHNGIAQAFTLKKVH